MESSDELKDKKKNLNIIKFLRMESQGNNYGNNGKNPLKKILTNILIKI